MSGNWQTLLVLPDIDALNIINITVNTIDMKDGNGTDNCYTNEAIPQSRWYEQQYTNMTQETERAEKCYTNTDSISKSDNTHKLTVENKLSNTIDYILQGPNHDIDKSECWNHSRCFNRIGCFDGTFSSQLKPDGKTYQAPPRHVAYALQKPFEEELKWLQKHDIITPLGIGETAEWCHNFVLVPISQIMPRLSKAKSSTHKDGAKGTHT